MFRLLLGLAFALVITPVQAQKQPPIAPPAYVSIIIKACPADPQDMERCEMAAIASTGFPTGMCAKAVNQGKSYEWEPSMTKEERNSYYSKIGCIDVPIPPEVIQGGEMTMERCRGHAGYLASMQYLEQNQTITQKAVGGWACISSSYPVEGVAAP